jgi:hypothetical protein
VRTEASVLDGAVAVGAGGGVAVGARGGATVGARGGVDGNVGGAEDGTEPVGGPPGPVDVAHPAVASATVTITHAARAMRTVKSNCPESRIR